LVAKTITRPADALTSNIPRDLQHYAITGGAPALSVVFNGNPDEVGQCVAKSCRFGRSGSEIQPDMLYMREKADFRRVSLECGAGAMVTARSRGNRLR
jgi:hypothetical protein